MKFGKAQKPLCAGCNFTLTAWLLLRESRCEMDLRLRGRRQGKGWGWRMADCQHMDAETRARWHLQLGYDEQELPPHAIYTEGDDFDDYDDDNWSCTHCGGEGYSEVNDPLWDDCDEFGWGPCQSCRGTGERRHQWVF